MQRQDIGLVTWRDWLAIQTDDQMDKIKELFAAGLTTKDDYEQSLRAYQKWQDMIKSEMRENAAEFELDRVVLVKKRSRRIIAAT